MLTTYYDYDYDYYILLELQQKYFEQFLIRRQSYFY